jgi:hypothetical protein
MAVTEKNGMTLIFAGDSQGWITVVTNNPQGGAQGISIALSGHTKEPVNKKTKQQLDASPIKLIYLNALGNITSVD